MFQCSLLWSEPQPLAHVSLRQQTKQREEKIRKESLTTGEVWSYAT